MMFSERQQRDLFRIWCESCGNRVTSLPADAILMWNWLVSKTRYCLDFIHIDVDQN